MRKNTHKYPAKKTKAKQISTPAYHNAVDSRFREVLGHAASNGLVQNIGIAFLLTCIGVTVSMLTSTQIKTAVITAALTGTAAIWVLAIVILRYVPDVEVKTDAIRFKVQTAIVPSDKGSLFFVRYKSSLGDTLSPMPIAIDATVTNIRGVPVSLDSISVDLKENRANWVKLENIPIKDNHVYWIYGDKRAARLLDFEKNGLEQLLSDRPLPPNDPVQGWLFFELPKTFDGEQGAVIQWRFTAHDTEGNRYLATSAPSPLTRQVKAGSDVVTSAPFLKATGAIANLSGLAVRKFHSSL